MLSERSQPQRRCAQDPDGGAGCQGLGEGRAGSVCVMGMEFQFEMMRRVPGKAGGDVCTTGEVYFIPWNCVRKMVNLTQYACSQLKKKNGLVLPNFFMTFL